MGSIIYIENCKTYISALRPILLADFYPNAGIKDIAQEIDKIILSIVDEAK